MHELYNTGYGIPYTGYRNTGIRDTGSTRCVNENVGSIVAPIVDWVFHGVLADAGSVTNASRG